MYTRLKQVRLAVGKDNKKLTQTEFAEALHVTRDTVASYELGRGCPSNLFIGCVCNTFGVNEEWLRTGEGEMFAPKDRALEIANIVSDLLDNEDSFKTKLILTLANMEEEQLVVLQQIAHELENQNSPLQ